VILPARCSNLLLIWLLDFLTVSTFVTNIILIHIDWRYIRLACLWCLPLSPDSFHQIITVFTLVMNLVYILLLNKVSFRASIVSLGALGHISSIHNLILSLICHVIVHTAVNWLWWWAHHLWIQLLFWLIWTLNGGVLVLGETALG
jgi:hypothetical protein